MPEYSHLLPFCTTEKQKERIEHLCKTGGNKTKTARDLGIDMRGLCRLVEKLELTAEARGVSPEHHRNHMLPSQQVVSGYSDLVRFSPDDPMGRIIGWVKSNRKIVDQLEDAKAVLEAMATEIEPIPEVKYKGKVWDKSRFSVIPVGDPHIGLRTWSKEVGENWDVPIAKRVFKKVFTRLLQRAPDTHEAVLVNTGDFFHADNIFGETSRSGHKLDMDGRPAYWLDAGVIIIRMLIDSCLAKYRKVTFVNVAGNHDDILGQALGVFSDHLYEKNKRLTVMRGESPFQYYHNGDVLLGFAHGHKCKLAALPGKMADDQSELWGKTQYRHWITGHVHHNSWSQFKEHPGAKVETVGIIPPKDAYAYGGAYGAGRGTQIIVFDKNYGEVDRYNEPVRDSD